MQLLMKLTLCIMMMKIMIINNNINNQENNCYKIFKNIKVKQKRKLKRNK